MLEHINLLNLKFLMFLYFHQHAINFCSFILFFSSCFVLVLFKSQKYMKKTLPFNRAEKCENCAVLLLCGYTWQQVRALC